MPLTHNREARSLDGHRVLIVIEGLEAAVDASFIARKDGMVSEMS